MATNEITKHIENTNANYRDVSMGDAKNTDLFLNQEHFNLFKNAGKNPGDKITVRIHKDNLSQAILFIASILPRKYDNGADHQIINYSQSFVFNQLAILNEVFQNNGTPVDTVEKEWTLRIGTKQKNGKIDNRFYINGLLERVNYTDINGNQVNACFTIRNYLAGGYSDVHIVETNGIFDFTITNSKDAYFDNSDPIIEDSDEDLDDQELEKNRKSTGKNILLYGVPGSGKSWTIENEYCNQDTVVSRLVFHPDYTNADFIGQILPVVDSEKQVTYEFTPGPFTTIIKNSYNNPQKEYVLIIEEINRGNAPAIFGEVFQLLDRTFEPKVSEGITYPKGTSEYGITHKNMALYIYGDETHKVRIPSNLSIIGTMNTSDQNVFTLDTAFQRRWQMRLIENNFDNVRVSLAEANILDTGVTWKKFCEVINGLIISSKSKMVSAEDKRLGVYFIHENDIVGKSIESPSAGFSTLKDEYNDLLKKQRNSNASATDITRITAIRNSIMDMSVFPQKVIKYLWDDAFKFNPEALFNMEGDGKLESLEQVIQTFVYSKGRERFKIFKQSVRDSL